MRKEAGFDVVDRIKVYYTSDDANVLEALKSDALKAVILADAVIEGESDGYTKELDVNGIKCIVSVVKAEK